MDNFINHIEISNFKSIQDLKVESCGKINIFVGLPNAGKSNILEALSLFSVIENQKNRAIKDFIRLGADVYHLFHEANITEPIEIKINDSSIKINQRKGGQEFKNVDICKLKVGHSEELYYEVIKQNTYPSIKLYKFNENSSKSVKYISDELMQPFGENIASVIFSDEKIRSFVIKIFENNHLKILFEKNSNEIKVFKEYQDGTVFTLPYQMVADTLQRLVFFKTLIMSNKNSILLLEEPEAHCFEPYILDFTNEVKYNKNNNQFFIVTHSDLIVQEFLRDEESKEQTQIYLVNNVEGKTQIKRLEKSHNEEVYDLGMNVFFNFEQLWESN